LTDGWCRILKAVANFVNTGCEDPLNHLRCLPFKKKVNAKIQLISGALIRFKASVMRRDESEVIFQFADHIGTALLMEEENAIAAVNDS
jgi:hypothetical protein